MILFEDEHLLIVNKPAGMNTHAPAPYSGEGIYDWLRHRERRWANLAIIHRLDKDTSGLLVFTKTALANRSLTEQFSRRAVKKRYCLVSDRSVTRDEIIAISHLRRVGAKYLSALSNSGAPRAETRFYVRNRLADRIEVDAEPITGRTHQIRAHAAGNGFPILGDVLYGGTPAGRLWLHAVELNFKHPKSGQEVHIVELPNFDLAPAKAIRAAFIDPSETNAFRRVHGSADGFPGWYIDQLGPYLLSQAERPLDRSQLNQLNEWLGKEGIHGVYHKILTRQVGQRAADENSPQHILGDLAPPTFCVLENRIQFELSFQEGYSVGLFLDQRDNRRRLLTGYVSPGFDLFEAHWTGAEVLNAFAYTCGFSVCAAKAGASVTSLDLSKRYLEWGKRNFMINSIDPADHDFVYGDVFDWLRRFAKKGRQFDAVILDPPTFSRSKDGGVFQAERDYARLVTAALPLVRRNGVLFCSTNAARLTPEQFVNNTREAVENAGCQIAQFHYQPQPPDSPITRDEPGYLKTLWLRVEKQNH